MTAESRALRMGILGAARIAPSALVLPALEVDGLEVVAVAARDVARGQHFAHNHRIARVHTSYDALIDDPEIDAIYNPLPNGLHHAWTIRALDAGKHVLCEKPIASNADEAAEMEEAAQRNGRTLMEAFHWRYHPLADRVLEILASGEIGTPNYYEANICFPLPFPKDIRYNLDLAGGATMDAGCYAVSLVRHYSGEEPEVVSSSMKTLRHRVDRRMDAELRFPSGATGRLRASMLSARLLDVRARIVGERGEIRVLNPLMPQAYHRLVVQGGADGKRVEKVRGEGTYLCQLRAFKTAIETGERAITDGRDAIANMHVIDALYDASGLGRRVA